MQIQLGGGKMSPEVDRVELFVVLPPYGTPKSELEFTVSVSDDARTWQKAGSVRAPEPASIEGYPREFARPGQLYVPSVILQSRVPQPLLSGWIRNSKRPSAKLLLAMAGWRNRILQE